MRRKNIWKSILLVVLALSMIVGCTTTGNPQTSSSQASSSQASSEQATSTSQESVVASVTEVSEADKQGVSGTYEAVTKGHNGDVTTKVTLEKGKLTAIEVVEHKETDSIAPFAFEKLIPEMIDNQSIRVEAVSGATVSSNALIEGVKKVLTEQKVLDDFDKEIEKKAGKTIEKDVDVLVVGAGGAGLSAAVEASKAGAKTLVIEKMPKIGGNTAICSGNIYATGSKTQEELGLKDNGTVEELTKFFMDQADGRANEDLIKVVTENSGATIDWLSKDIGIKFKHRSPDASHRSLISETSGVGITDNLSKKAIEQGTEILVDTSATELIVENNQVVGVKAKSGNDELVIRAKSVVLATGGYDGQDEAKAKYAPGSVGHHTFSSPGNVGDAIEMVKAVDGKILLKGGLSGIHLVGGQALNSPLSPLRMIAHGIGVTDLGYRYANESMTSAFDYYNPMVRTGRKQFYNIVDATVPNELLEKAVAEGEAFKADSIEELARLAGIQEYPLKVTVEEYNAACAAGVDKEFGKKPEDMKPLVKAPFYAVKITPNTNGSFGGLVTDLETRVLNNDNQPIPGLYAAGAVANSEFFYLRYPVSGSSLIMGITLGRIAGVVAAQNAK